MGSHSLLHHGCECCACAFWPTPYWEALDESLAFQHPLLCWRRLEKRQRLQLLAVSKITLPWSAVVRIKAYVFKDWLAEAYRIYLDHILRVRGSDFTRLTYYGNSLAGSVNQSTEVLDIVVAFV